MRPGKGSCLYCETNPRAMHMHLLLFLPHNGLRCLVLRRGFLGLDAAVEAVSIVSQTVCGAAHCRSSLTTCMLLRQDVHGTLVSLQDCSRTG